jgi:hypothetical protein
MDDRQESAGSRSSRSAMSKWVIPVFGVWFNHGGDSPHFPGLDVRRFRRVRVQFRGAIPPHWAGLKQNPHGRVIVCATAAIVIHPHVHIHLTFEDTGAPVLCSGLACTTIGLLGYRLPGAGGSESSSIRDAVRHNLGKPDKTNAFWAADDHRRSIDPLKRSPLHPSYNGFTEVAARST